MTSLTEDDRESAALWQLLSVSLDEDRDEGHNGHIRIVLYGRPGSGKRTICQRLYAAASYECDGDSTRTQLTSSPAQLSSARNKASCGALVLEQKSVSLTRLNDVTTAAAPPLGAPLATTTPPSSDVPDDAVRAEAMFGEGGAEAWLPPQLTAFATRASDRRQQAWPRGAGVAYACITHDIHAQAHSTVSSLSRLAPLRREVDFFCCDTPGALHLALPTPSSLQEAVVLLVVDVSHPEQVRDELRALYASLQEHVRSILTVHAPTHDEIALLKLSERREAVWAAEESRRSVLRSTLQRTARVEPHGAVHPELPRADTEQDDARLSSLYRATLCPVQSIVVASKVDLLTRRSAAVAEEARRMMARTSRTAESALFASSFYASVRRCQMSVFDYVMQAIRLECIQRRSALVTISCEVQTTARTDVDGDRCTLVHPFYKALWSYIMHLVRLVSTGGEPATLPTTEQDGKAVWRETVWDRGEEGAAWVRLLPAGIVPLGVDAPSLLHSYVIYSATLHDHVTNDAPSPLTRADTGWDDYRASDLPGNLHEAALQQIVARSTAPPLARLYSETTMPSSVTSPPVDSRRLGSAPEQDNELIWETL